jgi:hypothetical protein
MLIIFQFIAKYKTYLLIGLVVLAFFGGQMSTPHGDVYEREKNHAIEKRILRDKIEYLEIHLAILNRQDLTIREKVTKDSLYYSNALKVKDARIKILEKHIKNVPKFHTAADLDSAIRSLYAN